MITASDTAQRKWFILAAMCLAIFTVAYNTTAILNATVAIRNELKLTTTNLSWVINAYMLTTASCIIIGGQFGDLYGRKKMFYLGVLLFMLASGLIASAHTFEVLLLSRILQGFGAAFITPGTLAVVKTTFSHEEDSFAISIWMGAIGLGFAAGPTFSGIITDVLSWRHIFLINLPILLASLIIVFVKSGTAKHVPKKNAHLDILGVVLLIAGILPFTLGLIEGNNWGWNSYATIGLMVVGAFVLMLFWQVEVHMKDPLVNFPDFHKHAFLAGNLAMGTNFIVIITLLYFVNIYMQTPVLLNFTALRAGIALLPFSLGMFITATFFSAPILNRYGFRTVISASLFAISVAFAYLSLVQADTSYFYLLSALIVIGVGLGISNASAPALGMSALPDSRAGEASGEINTFGYMSAVIALSVGTILFHHFGITAAHRVIGTFYFSNIQMHQIDEILLGDNSALHLLMNTIPQVKKGLVTHALQSGALASFRSVMMMGSVVSLAAAITCFQLIPKVHGR